MTDSARAETGDRGERIAAAHLAEAGWTIRATNWDCKIGELDIVASREETFAGTTGERLAFVEVKSRASDTGPAPQYNVTERKRRKITQLAEIYLDQRDGPPCSAQFDVVTVDLSGSEPDVRHFSNAFDAVGRLN